MRPEGIEASTSWSDPPAIAIALEGIRTPNFWSEAKRDIHFTTRTKVIAGRSQALCPVKLRAH